MDSGSGKRQAGDPGGPLVEAVVFDYGGVLTTPVGESIRSWLRRDRIDPASFSRTLKSWLSRDAPDGTPVHRLETGHLNGAEFDALLAAELVALEGGPVNPVGLLDGMFADMLPDQQMFDLAAASKAAGAQVALLSNSWGNTYSREKIDALFSPVVISGEVGMRKPNREIFERVLELLGLPAERVAFVDDAGANIEAAQRFGLRGILHSSARTTRAELARLLPALGAPASQRLFQPS